MGPQGVWQAWEAEVSRVLSSLGVRQRRVLALFSLGVALAKHCGLARVAAVVPGLAVVPSITRRFERLLANRRLVYRERAIPLAWVCYRPGEAPAPFPVLIGRLIHEVAALIPSDTPVVLMTDRGLSWPSLLGHCRRVGWSFLCRVQRQTRVQTVDGRAGTIGDLAPHPGARWRGRGRAFLEAGWRDLNLVAVWRRGDEQPWLLVTDLAPAWVRCDQYRHRMDEEESFRDDESAGFAWDASRVRDPAHMDRLLLVLQLAALLVLVQGAFVLQHGFRRVLERPDRTTLSLFSLGLRWLDRARSHLVPLAFALTLPFP